MTVSDLTTGQRNGAALTVLVVDDAPDMRFLAKAVLESSGLRVVGEAADGPEALLRVRDLDPPPVPTVILLDNQMPGPTGLEVAAEILARTPEQLIVLFSAYLSDEVIAEATRMGVAACVSKVEVNNLPTIIRDLVASRG
jgi:two-component system, chemotaxis family, chemotaxis protein CheY